MAGGEPSDPAGVGRLGPTAAWISAVCWRPMALVQLAALLLVLALIWPWGRRIPAWTLLLPVWVGTGLLFQVVVGAALVGLLSPSSETSGGSTESIQTWVFVFVYASFAGQGIALAVAFGAHVRARWGRLLGRRTGEVVAGRTDRVRSWRESHLAEMSEVVAGMAFTVSLVFWYWAAGGSFGSGAQPHPAWPPQASRAAGAAIVVVGLLGLAGSWGRQTRFWLPASLIWVGSGAVAAFDGFMLVFNRLFVRFGMDTAEQGSSLIDTVLVIKVVFGVLAAGVGALAVTAAAKDDQMPRGTTTTQPRALPGLRTS